MESINIELNVKKSAGDKSNRSTKNIFFMGYDGSGKVKPFVRVPVEL